MLNKAIADKLNEQINLEFYSSNVYLQMSSWCSKHGYEGAAAFLLRHADEELEHMQKLLKLMHLKMTINHLKKYLKLHLNMKNSLLLKLMN